MACVLDTVHGTIWSELWLLDWPFMPHESSKPVWHPGWTWCHRHYTQPRWPAYSTCCMQCPRQTRLDSARADLQDRSSRAPHAVCTLCHIFCFKFCSGEVAWRVSRQALHASTNMTVSGPAPEPVHTANLMRHCVQHNPHANPMPCAVLTAPGPVCHLQQKSQHRASTCRPQHRGLGCRSAQRLPCGS